MTQHDRHKDLVVVCGQVIDPGAGDPARVPGEVRIPVPGIAKVRT